MNRIILIGNGFDLAHAIKTSYSHFINDYWETVIQKLRSEVNGNYTTYSTIFETEEIKIDDVPGGPYVAGDWVQANNFDDLVTILKQKELNVIFKNKFLEILTKKQKERNWVDIENEYYNLLKSSFKDQKCTYQIEDLNNDLNQIKNLLELYLKRVEDEFHAESTSTANQFRFIKNIAQKIYSPFKLKDFTETSINKKTDEEFQKITKDLKALKDDSLEVPQLNEKTQKLISDIPTNPSFKDIRKLLLSDNATKYFELIPEEILFLNFNYTFTEDLYTDQSKFSSSVSSKIVNNRIIHIHGTTSTDEHENNPVIFGFGDEIDEDYKSIENLNDNVYLENIKSIKYLENDNYKELLEFLNIGDYQIFIFGHSCGISDRTLLNTLFEHKNCSSIKPFYHNKENGNDNYSDIVRNISRNFNSKSSMRDKVVNKNYCEPLS